MLSSAAALTPQELKSAIIREPLLVSPETTVTEAIVRMSSIRSCCMPTAVADCGDGEHFENSSHTDLALEIRSSCVLVVEGNELRGILTERDIVRLSAQEQRLDQLTLKQVMVQSVITLQEPAFTDLFTAIDLLQGHGIRHLPIVNALNQPIGLVTHDSLRQVSRPADLLRLRLVKEVMTRQVIQAPPDCTMLTVAQRMAEHRVSCVVIVEPLSDVQVKPVGILTERDIVQFQSLSLDLKACAARTVMSQPIFSVQPEESLARVQTMMVKHFIRRLAVTGPDQELLGIVTQTSLLQALQPLEIHKHAEVLEARVLRLEAERVELLENRTTELEQEVAARTAALKVKVEQQKLLSVLATKIQSSLSLPKILETTVQQVQVLLECERVNIWRFEKGWTTSVVAESTHSPISLMGKQVSDGCFKAGYVEAYRQGRCHVVFDIYETEISDCHREMLKDLQVRAKILVPLLCGTQLWGLLSVSESQQVRHWSQDEVELLQSLAVKLAIAIQQAVTHQQLQEELVERQQAEARLRESEQRFSSLAAVAPVGIVRLDLEGNCTYFNDRCAEIIGFSPTTALGSGWKEFLHPDDRSRFWTEWLDAVKAEKPFQLEYCLQRPDKTEVWVYGQSTAEYDTSGKVIGYVGTVMDISDRKRVENEILNHNALLSKIAEDKPLNDILNAVVESTESSLDGALCSVMLLDSSQLWHGAAPNLPSGWIETTHGVEIGRCVGSCGRAAFLNQTVITADIATDPHWQDYSTAALDHGLRACWSLPITSISDRVLGTIAIYHRESRVPTPSELALVGQTAKITGILLERKQSEEALRISELKYRHIVETANEGIWVVDAQAKTTFVNPKMAEMLGYRADEMLGKFMLDFMAAEGLTAKTQTQDRWSTLSDQQDFKLQHKNGAEVWALVSTTPTFDEAGQPTGALNMIMNISDRKRTERELQSLVEGTAATTGEDFFPALLSHIAAALDIAYAMVTEYADDQLYTLAFWADGALQPNFCYQPARTPCLLTLTQGSYFCELNLRDTFSDNEFLAEIAAESYLGIALYSSSGAVIGNLCILSKQSIHDPQRAENLLRVFAARAAAELERKRAIQAIEELNKNLERRVQERTAALQSSEELWHLALRGANDGIWDWNLKADQMFFSDRWKEIRGFESSEIGNTLEEYISRIHPDDFDCVMKATDDHLKGRSEFFEVEYRTQCKDGSYMWVLDRAQALRDASGSVIRMTGSETDITQRKQAETDLSQSKQFLQTVLDTFPISIFWKDCHSAYLGGNAKFLTDAGFSSASEILNKTDFDMPWGSTEAETYRADDQAVIAEGKSKIGIVETQLQANGNQLWVETSKSPLRNLEGEIIGVVGTYQDISDRMKAAAELAESRQKYYSLIQSVNGIVWEYDPQTDRFTFVSNKAEELLDYPIENWLSESQFWKSRIYEADRAEAERCFYENIDDGSSCELEYRMVAADGSPVWVYHISSPNADEDGTLETISGVLINISDRKQAEMALQTKTDEFNRFFSLALDLLCIASIDGYFLHVNNQWEKALGYAQSEIEGTRFLDHVHPEDVEKTVNAIAELSMGKEILNFVNRYACKDGSYRWIEWRALPNNQLIYAAARDVTDRKESETKLQQTNEELARATRLKDEFLANMSHELRTPLNAILGMTEGLQDAVFGVVNPMQIKALQTIERSGSHLLELINDILDIAKIEAGQIDLKPSPVSINALCQASLSFIRQQSFQKHLHLNCNIEPDLPDLFIDERRIRQVLINLLNNAVKFTPEGGTITLDVRPSDIVPSSNDPRMLRISIADTGIGIAAEHIGKLFQPFIQIDSALNRKFAGTGLGLALVKRIVELHGGQVSLVSELGVGSCFTIDLPCARDALSQSLGPATAKLSPDAALSGPLGRGALILLAEDNEANVSTLSSYLRAKGYSVVVAANGREAVLVARAERPHLILMDIQMPEMDGLEAIRQIRQCPELSETPIIALTALVMSGDRDKCFEAGANEYVTKPVRLGSLSRTISTLLQAHHEQLIRKGEQVV